jgi:hypothetical protein
MSGSFLRSKLRIDPDSYSVAEFGPLLGRPVLTFLVLTYERPDLLKEFLASLADVHGYQRCQLVIINNGSDPETYDFLAHTLKQMEISTTVLTFSHNLLGPRRINQAVRHCRAEYVSHPGDDDLLLPSIVDDFMDLLEREPEALCYVAPAIGCPDDAPEHVMPVPNFSSSSTAVGALLSRNPYPLPSAFIHSSLLHEEPRSFSRTAADWNLWLRAWMRGKVVAATKPTVVYRLHSRQEQRSYYAGSGYSDAVRMLGAVISSIEFRKWAQNLPEESLVAFASTILEGPGVAQDAGPESGLLQLLLADVIRDLLPIEWNLRMYAQGSVTVGLPMSPAALATAANSAGDTPLPSDAWRRASVGLEIRPSSSQVPDGIAELTLPKYTDQTCKVQLRAGRGHPIHGSYELLVYEKEACLLSRQIRPQMDSPTIISDLVLQGVSLALRSRFRTVPSPLAAKIEAIAWKARSIARKITGSGSRPKPQRS